MAIALLSRPLPNKRTVLGKGVSDEGLRMLATAGCGENLRLLSLSGERQCVLLSSGRGTVGQNTSGMMLAAEHSFFSTVSVSVLSLCLLCQNHSSEGRSHRRRVACARHCRVRQVSHGIVSSL